MTLSNRPALRRVLRAVRRTPQWLCNSATRPLRRALVEGRAGWLEALPAQIRRTLDLDGGPVQPLRVELGGGPFPTPGYVHVDHDWRARHLEHLARAWRLPFGSSEVHELLAVHVLEHVHPGRVAQTLGEWHRVLRHGGILRVHVPNGPAVFDAFNRGPVSAKWALMTAFFGYGNGPELSSPTQFGPHPVEPDHRAIYDFPLLQQVLDDAGFSDVQDLTETVTDRHTEGWESLVPRMSLVVQAVRA